MAAIVECSRCHGTFAGGEPFLEHVTDGTCRPLRRVSWITTSLATVGAAVVMLGLLRLGATAAANPGGVASWVRLAVAVAIAAGGVTFYAKELER